MALPEPWLRGPIDGLPPVLAHVSYTFQQVREELDRWTENLDDRVWLAPAATLPPLGFHLRHLAGSADRLFTYLMAGSLSPEQLAFLKKESEPGATLGELRQALDAVFTHIETTLHTLDPATLGDQRKVGRQGLPTTVAGLAIHLAEHTQRHLGQAVLTAKLLRESR